MALRGLFSKFAVAAVAGIVAAPALGTTVQNFDGVGNPFTTAGNNGGALPAVVAGGPTGSFLRVLPDGIGSLLNKAGFDKTDSTTAISVSFDARMPVEATHTGCCGQRADGFGVAFLGGSHGVTGAGPDISERPNLPDAFAIGFDIFEGPSNTIYSINRNGAQVVTADIQNGVLNLNNGLFNRYDVTMTPTATGTAVTVVVTPDIHGTPGTPVTVFNNVNIEGVSPGGRLAIGGRTGGAFTGLDVDNVSAQYANVLEEITKHDFDSVGTGFNSVQRGSAPGPRVLAGGPSGSFLRLVNDGVNSQENSIAFNATRQGQAPTDRLTAEFDFRIISTDAPADGFSMLLIPTAIHGTSGVGQVVAGGAAEEPNFPGIIAVGFDLFSNENDASLHFGNEIVNVDLNPAVINLDSGAFHHARLELNDVGGQVLASLFLTSDLFGVAGPEVAAFSNVAIPGLTDLYAYRVQFAGRTGGLNMTVDLDNVNVRSFNPVPEPASALLGLIGLGTLALRRRREA